jgi:hypothetical protein
MGSSLGCLLLIWAARFHHPLRSRHRGHRVKYYFVCRETTANKNLQFCRTNEIYIIDCSWFQVDKHLGLKTGFFLPIAVSR